MPKFNMTPGVTPVSHDIFDLHMTIFFICVIIGILVFGVLIYALIKHRKSKGHKPAKFHENLKIEILWTIVPFLILIAMAVPATKILIRMADDSHSDVSIKVVGYQWKWRYEYLDEGISFFSNISTPQKQIQNMLPKNKWYLLEVDKPLVVPIHKKIRFIVTSNDVIHSWWVPALGIKRDAIPGFIHEAWARIDKPGIYRGQCAELCGIHHAYMPIVVVAKTEKGYQEWLAKMKGEKPEVTKPALTAEPMKKIKDKKKPVAEKKWTQAELMKKGKDVYDRFCSVCHKDDGKGTPPVFPSMVGSKIVTGPIKTHIKTVLNGLPGTAMQAFGQQLSDEDIAAVVTFERNSWGNNDKKYGAAAGGIATLADVKKEKAANER